MSFADAQRLARRIAERVSSARGEALWLRDYPAQVDGDVGFVALGVAEAVDVATAGTALWRAIALVSDLGPVRTLERAGRRGGVAAVVGDQGEGDADVVRHGDELARVLEQGWLDEVGLGALEAGVALLDGLGATLGVLDSRWRLGAFGQWDERVGASGAYVELAGAHEWERMVWLTQEARGVTISLPPDAFGKERIAIGAASPAELAASLGALREAAQRAVDARATFWARPFSAAKAGKRLESVLREAEVGPGRVRFDGADGAGFPVAWPQGTLWRVDRLGSHAVAVLRESSAGVEIAAGREIFRCATAAELDACLDAIVEAARETAARLTTDKLEPGACYKVVRAFGSLEEGAKIRFVRRQHVVYDGFDIHHFERDPSGEPIALYEIDPSVEGALRELHLHLEPIEGA